MINVHSLRHVALAGLVGMMMVPVGATMAAAQSKPVASVNGKTLTEADLALAEADIGGDLGLSSP